jgi:hypothetical protein
MEGIGDFFTSPINIVLIIAAVAVYFLIVSRRKN